MLPDHWLEWNRTEVGYPRNSTIAEQFRQRAALTPDAIALIFKDRKLSYRELDERSNCLSGHLQAHGVKQETLVGVFMGRSELLVICLFAILKSGGAYVPLDPGYPKERLSYIIEDSGIHILITSSEMRNRDFLGNAIVFLDADAPTSTPQASLAITPAAGAHNLAYVMYTSGSTGRPKGVMIENCNVINFFTGMDRAIGCDPGVWLGVTSVAFDISVLELLWTLTRGFTVIVHGDDNIETIADEILRHNVSHIQMTPSLAHMLLLHEQVHRALGSLKQILLGGEAVPASIVRRLRQVFTGEIYNMYGPTETTIWSTTYRVTEPGSTVPIGRPIANTKIFILDLNLNPALAGETGEIFIGGEGVARGYWKRPELDAERFLNLHSLPEQRVYRTGDMGRILPDGNMEFLGRTDHQIKLRGHRIEPGEIETVLEYYPGVMQAVVVAREDREGDKRLVAYMVANGLGKESVGMLKEGLAAKLPEIMIPSAFVFLSEMPTTSNGKIDRKALLASSPPTLQDIALVSHSRGEIPNKIEGIVYEVWKEALGLPSVGLNQNFFELGAHSLTLAEVQAKLKNALQREISIVDLFEFPTIVSLSRHLSGSESAATAARAADRAQRRKLAKQR